MLRRGDLRASGVVLRWFVAPSGLEELNNLCEAIFGPVFAVFRIEV